MRVIHLTPATFEKGRRGGGERYFNEYVAVLERTGLNQDLYSVPTPYSAWRVDRSSFEAQRVTIRSLHKALATADIVHVHQLNTPGLDHALLQRLSAGTKLVISDYGGGRLTPGRLLGRLRNRAIDGNLAISRWSVDDVDPRHVIPLTTVIYGGGDHVLRFAAEQPARGKTSDFLFVGRLLPHKGAHVAIEALPEGATLVIAGETRNEEYLSHLHHLARGRRVEFVGSPDDERLPELYASARCLVLPSVERYGQKTYARPELLGLVVLEALACGTPAIGSRTGGLAEVLDLADQYSAISGDVNDWRRVMGEALRTPKKAHLGDFTWRRVAELTLDHYQAVLNER